MALFPKEAGATTLDAPGRMAWTRERGTRKLLLAFIGLLLVWYAVGKINDARLLRTEWPVLKSDPAGLTIVGTLDSRAAYDRNLFRIIQSNKSARVELTDFGWRTIFSGSGNDMLRMETGDIIQEALKVDSVAGYAMLGPFVRAGVQRFMGKSAQEATVDKAEKITLRETQGNQETAQQVELGTLLAKYSKRERGQDDAGDEGASEGGSGSGREVEHGVFVPAELLLEACPVVLTKAHLQDAWLEENPPTIIEGKTFKVHLGLTPEGRSRFFQWSHAHANENLVLILKGQVVAAGRIVQTLDVNDWAIGPLRDEAAAKALVDFVKGGKG